MTAISGKKLLQIPPYNGAPWKACCGICHASTTAPDHPLMQQHFNPTPQPGKFLCICLEWNKDLSEGYPHLTATMTMFTTAASTSPPSLTTATRLSVAPIKIGDQPNHQDDSVVSKD